MIMTFVGSRYIVMLLGRVLCRRLITVQRSLSSQAEGVDVSTAHDGRTVILTLRNEGKMNCMTETIASQFQETTQSISKSHPQARCVIVTGHGKSFAAGADLAWLKYRTETSPSENKPIMLNYYNYFTSLISLPLPTIAAINGPAVGAGFCVTLFCDIRITSDDSKLGANFVKLGINPGMGGTYTLLRKIPSQIAYEVLYTGRIFTGSEAADMGLVLRSLKSKEMVLDDALNLAKDIGQNSPIAMRETVRLLRDQEFSSLKNAMSQEAESQARCFAENDIKLGLDAVINKRSPAF